jgi:hypothetical protein
MNPVFYPADNHGHGYNGSGQRVPVSDMYILALE